jgi:hypothetical protein
VSLPESTNYRLLIQKLVHCAGFSQGVLGVIEMFSETILNFKADFSFDSLDS